MWLHGISGTLNALNARQGGGPLHVRILFPNFTWLIMGLHWETTKMGFGPPLSLGRYYIHLPCLNNGSPSP